MDATTRYSVGAVVSDTGTKATISALDSHWISPFSAPNSIQFDQAFSNQEFENFHHLHGISARPIPADRNKIMFRNQFIK